MVGCSSGGTSWLFVTQMQVLLLGGGWSKGKSCLENGGLVGGRSISDGVGPLVLSSLIFVFCGCTPQGLQEFSVKRGATSGVENLFGGL